VAFLLVQILALIVLSAAGGAWLAYWWLRRGVEDVSAEYEALTQRTRALEAQKPLLDTMSRRLEAIERDLGDLPEPPVLSARIAEVDRKVDAWTVAGVEGHNRVFERVSSVLTRMETLPPQADLEPVLARLDAVTVDFDPVLERLAAIEERVGADLAGLAERVRALEERQEASRADVARAWSSGQSEQTERLRALEHRIASLPAPDLEPVLLSTAGIAAAVGGLRMPSLGPVEERLARLEERIASLPPPPDLAELDGRVRTVQDAVTGYAGALDTLTDRIAVLRAPEIEALLPSFEALKRKLDGLQTPDVTDLSAGVSALTSTVAALRVPNFEQLGQRLQAIEQRVTEGCGRSADLGPVLARLAAIEGRIEGAPAPPASDPIEAERRHAGRNMLRAASWGPPDNLEIVRGIGPRLVELLNELGVYYFWQIAEWGPDDVAFVDARLEQFQGRIERDAWVAQCVELAAAPDAARPPR
jgi:predicted flap endonuclease-1-like 5' DNA nuclease/uncharacterized coiled-coil protein SlyX